MDRIEISEGTLGDAEAAAAFRAVFPAPGEYVVAAAGLDREAIPRGVEGLLAKAPSDVGVSGDFDEWFLQRLFDASRGQVRTSQQAIWDVMDRFLTERGVRAPSELDQWELNRRLFDLSHASTARITGLRIPAELNQRLSAMGWQPGEVLDFPAIAYRVGRIYDDLLVRPTISWSEVLARADARPLSSVERVAVERARAHAGVFLKPIYDDTGAIWTAERELVPLRRLTSRVIADRTSVAAAARELGKLERAEGIFRDAERVMRTEIAEHVGHGHWAEGAKRWAPDQLLWRPTSSTPCKVCLRLFKLPTGMPRLYTRAEVEAQDALGINTGPTADWHVRIGTIHPNCVCPPWQTWHEASRAIVERRAPEFAALMRQLKVFPDQEAA